MRPLLKRTVSVRVDLAEAPVQLRYLNREIALRGVAREAFTRALPLLDGERTTQDIAKGAAVAAPTLERLLGSLMDAGVLVDQQALEEKGGMTGLEFYDYHRRYSAHWLRPVYEHPFWGKVTRGEASRAQVIGFAFEKYHYIEGAHEHMAFAAANADSAMMKHLAMHFNEEYTHGDIYRAGLRAFYDDSAVLDSQPLPTTRALINYLSEMAQKSSFAYYAGNELLQLTENTSDGSDEDSVEMFYASMLKHYTWSKPLIKSFRAHTALDQQLGHEDAFQKMCADKPWLSWAEVSEAMNYTRGMAEMLELFMDGIDQYYARMDLVPRMASHVWAE